MHHDALALVYARSLFELARDAGEQAKIEEIDDELEQLTELARGLPDFGRFLDSPIIDRNARREALRKIFDGRLTDLTLRFLLVLNDKERLNKLSAIAEAYDHLVQEAFGRIEVDVFTAAVLDEEPKAIIRDRIATALGKEPVLHSYADPDMIGGIKLRIADQLIDGSVQTRLRQMKSELLRSGGWKLRNRIGEFLEDNEEDPS